jgi:HlyD family secretion protein
MRFFFSSASAPFLIGSALLASQLMAVATADEGDAAPAKIEVSGVLEAVRSVEITTDTEHLGALKIKKLIEHGVDVTKGQSLIWFETEDVDKKIKAAETALHLSRLTLEGAEFSHEQAAAKEGIERGKAERALAQARQTFDNYVTVDRERQLAGAEFDVVNARASLENATEELEQLEQMYKEDDLTEESEEIVLKRAKQAVDSARFRLEGVEITSERSITQTIPNALADQEDTLALAELAHHKAMRDLAVSREQREIELQKTREAFHDEEKKLTELKEERRRLVLTSPIDGIALHGQLTRGRLGDKPSQLTAGSTLAATQVAMTIVDPSRLQARVDLDEKQAALLNVGDTCTVAIAGAPGLKATGKIVSLGAVPYASSKYDCVVKLDGLKRSGEAKPLMTCTLTFTQESDQAPQADDEEKTAE